MKKIISLLLSAALCVPVFAQPDAYAAADFDEAAAAAESAVINYSRTVPIEVKGNRLVEEGTDNTVVLRGVNVPSLGWGMAEHLYESMTQVYDGWQGNVIRLPIQPKYWFNGNYDEDKGMAMSAEEYRQHIDDMVSAAQARGKYIILDCHTYVMPIQESLDMWLEVAKKYKNNSAVLFGLLNEPHDIKPAGDDAGRSAWDVWRNGGVITMNGEEVTGIGHQKLLEAIRATGANNICIAGGLNWAFDISGLADGYDGLEHGYRLTDTAEGNGVMYDSHAYPSKGAKSSWDKTLGEVRKSAPILIGEWGWDSSDKAISGGDCTNDIWMNQMMSWMDDEYGEYGGVPVNWTAWNLHMSSSPRMILSWDFKTTPYNGTYIAERLMSYGSEPERFDGVYESDLSSKDDFRSYTGVNQKSSVTYFEENENVVMEHQADTWYGVLGFPYDWDLNGIQTITMDISSDISETVNIGLYGADMEAWTTPVDIDNEVKTITVNVSELRREGNPLTDGVLNGAVSGIYLGAESAEKGSITIDNIKAVKLEDAVYEPVECPHTDTGSELFFDIDNTDFIKESTVKGPAETSYFNTENVTVEDYAGSDTVAKKISYNRTDGPWGGSVQYELETVPTMNAKYFTIKIKGSGAAQTIGISLGDIASFNAELAEGDTGWKQYIFPLDGNVGYPEDIQYIKFTSGTKTESCFYADDMGFTAEKPERVIPYPEKTFVYDFAAYKKNSYKYEAVTEIQDGDDTVSAEKVTGGLDYETEALEIKYDKGEGSSNPSKVNIVYSSSDFFKGNANDDERTEYRKYLKNDMQYMTDLVFYGKSTSGKNEMIKIGVLDAADGMKTPTDEKEFVLTGEWQQFRLPFDEFSLRDGGSALDCSRVRGFIISSAENSGSGSFMIDNITHTSKQDIDWSVPTPSPSPTATTAPTSTPKPTQGPVVTPVPGEPRTVTTPEEILSLTSSDSHVILGADINVGSSQVKHKCAMTLDLNGHTLSGSGNGVIDSTNDLTIIDSSAGKTGAVYNSGTGTSSYAVKAAKNITIKGGTFTGGQALLASSNGGTLLTVEGGTFEATNSNGFAFNISNFDVLIKDCTASNNMQNGGVLKTAGEADVTILDGEFSASGNIVNNASKGSISLAGGKFTSSGKGRGVLYLTSGGAINVSGGEFVNTSEDNPIAVQLYRNASGSVTLENGIFKGGISKDKASTAEITVKGGTYSHDPSQFVAAGFTVTETADGYTVSEGSGTSGQYDYSLEIDGGKIRVSIIKPAKLEPANVYTAAYDENGVLTGVFIEKNVSQSADYEYDAPQNTDSVKVFLWDSRMRPFIQQ